MKPFQKEKIKSSLEKLPSTPFVGVSEKYSMYKAGYRFIGKHSAIKLCHYTKQSIKGKDVCYKCQFYGISSHRCIQMTTSVFFCSFNCPHCWRAHRYVMPPNNFEWDKPSFIVNSCIKEQKKYLQGFLGEKEYERRLLEALMPKHFAISLAGEPTLYPYLPEFIKKIKDKDMTSFLVTNGCFPEMIEKLLNKKHQPTNLYISLYGYNKQMYKKVTAPIIKDFFERITKSLDLLKEFSCNTVIRLTLTRDLNLKSPEKFAKLIEESQTKFVECKGFMAVGGARKRLGLNRMPTHREIKKFAGIIEKNSSYKVVDEKQTSNVVLLVREDLIDDYSKFKNSP